MAVHLEMRRLEVDQKMPKTDDKKLRNRIRQYNSTNVDCEENKRQLVIVAFQNLIILKL